MAPTPLSPSGIIRARRGCPFGVLHGWPSLALGDLARCQAGFPNHVGSAFLDVVFARHSHTPGFSHAIRTHVSR